MKDITSPCCGAKMRNAVSNTTTNPETTQQARGRCTACGVAIDTIPRNKPLRQTPDLGFKRDNRRDIIKFLNSVD